MQVVKEKLAGPYFVWLLPGWYRANWWTAVNGTDCTAEEMSKALEHTIVGNGIAIHDDDLSRILASNKVRASSTCSYKVFISLMLHRMFLTSKKIWILKLLKEQWKLMCFLMLVMCMMQCGPLL